MNAAFTEACQTLKIRADNPSRAMLAHIIIWLVEDGKMDTHQLAIAAANGFRRLQP